MSNVRYPILLSVLCNNPLVPKPNFYEVCTTPSRAGKPYYGYNIPVCRFIRGLTYLLYIMSKTKYVAHEQPVLQAL